jgi:glutamate-1-semialdehyde aminotransferase
VNEEQRYRSRTPASARHFEEARRYLPGGDSRSTLFYPPYPAVLDRGEGHWVMELDRNRLLDFPGNHSALSHGYLEPAVMDAIRAPVWRRAPFPRPNRSAAQARATPGRADRLTPARGRLSSSFGRSWRGGTEARTNCVK